jgi:hypothetical protein
MIVGIPRHVTPRKDGAAGGVCEMRPGQIGALSEDGRRRPGGFGSIDPRIVIAWGGGSIRRSAWASTSEAAS